MFGMFGNRGGSAEDKRQEALNAYLDNWLSAAERGRLENQLARDAELRAELERLRTLKVQLRSLPRRRVPRSFVLDPALHGRPKRQPLMQVYPVLRGATALTAVLLVFTLALGTLRDQNTAQETAAPAAAELASSDEAGGEFAPIEESALSQAAATPDSARSVSSPAAEKQEMPSEESQEAEAPADLALEQAAAPAAGTAPEATIMLEGALAEEGVDESLETAEALADALPAATMSAQAYSPVTAAGAAAESTAVPVEVEQTTGFAIESMLGSVQIALAIVFAVLLVLWLIARHRMRSL